LIPGSQLPVRNRRIPAGDPGLQSITNFNALAIDIALAKAVPSTSLGRGRSRPINLAERVTCCAAMCYEFGD
jgi:hypothetical protein